MKRQLCSIVSAACVCAMILALTGCSGEKPAPSKSSAKKTGATTATSGGSKTAAKEGGKEPGKGAGESKTATGGWGTLRGKFVFDGPAPAAQEIDTSKDPMCSKHKVFDEQLVVSPEGGLANVVVYCRTKDVKVNPSLMADANGKVVLDNNGCRFEPRVLPMLVSQTLVIKNSDQTNHNTNSSPIGDQAFNPIIPIGGSAEEHLKKVQAIPQPVACNIHGWMKAHILPRDNPYFAVSKPDGTFEIKDLPTGELEFQAWQEKSGFLNAPGWTSGRFKFDIKPGDNDLGTIKLNPSLFAK